METKKIQIIQKTLELFQIYGIKSVSMDDISSQMAMSKKTLYLHFSDKKDLVAQVIDYNFIRIREIAEVTFIKEENAIDQVLALITFLKEIHDKHSHTMVFDLQKYFPEEHQKLRKHRGKILLDFHTNNIKKGIEQGLYRKDMNVEMVPKIILLLSEIIVDNDVVTFENISHPDFIEEMLIYHLHGVVNEKGHKYLNKKTTK